MRRFVRIFAAVCFAPWLIACGCIGGNGNSSPSDGNARVSDARRLFPLDSLETAQIMIGDDALRVWIMDTSAKQQEGLMHVPPEEIEDDQGMLFVFPEERQRGFWMLNTITPLDIAYARADGVIVTTWQMPPQTLETFPSIEPAMFALEMKQGSFARLGIREGDRLIIPNDVFKSSR